MADTQKAKDRSLRRCHESGRLEEQLWNMAYEQIWPVARGQGKRRTQRPVLSTEVNIPVVRRA